MRWRSVGIFRTDGKTSLRALQGCIQKVLCVDVSLGLIYKELTRVSQIAERINLKVSPLVSLSHCVMDEVWIRVAKRDEPSMGIKVLEHKGRGFNPSILTSDLLFHLQSNCRLF